MSTGSQELLEAVRSGDQGAFEQLVDPYRGELHAHCYRLLGSVHDADDALQDAMLRAWRAIGRFEGRSSLKSWLYRIATNTSMDVIGRRDKRVLPIDHVPPSDPFEGPGEPLVESVWIEPYPDEQIGLADGYSAPDASYEMRESVELAFVAALQHLPATQRAVLIMREVLGFSAQECADLLDTTTASVNSALQRARAAVEQRAPEQSQQATLRALGDDTMRKLVEDYMDAMQSGDVDRVVSMLADDADWSMPPLASWYDRERIPDFLRVGPLSGKWRWKRLVAHANGQPAVAAYTWDEDQQAYLAFALDVLTFNAEGKITDITAFINRRIEGEDREYYKRWPEQGMDEQRTDAIFSRFGLPSRLD